MASKDFIIQDPRHYFIAYKRDTGKDFAEHIHEGLHARGVDAFLDFIDIEEGLSRDEWEKQRDDAIKKSNFFILIVTHNTCETEEIKKEMKLAISIKNIDIRGFIYKPLWNKEEELIVDLGNEKIDLRKHQIRQFETKESLLREVLTSLPLVKQKHEIKYYMK